MKKTNLFTYLTLFLIFSLGVYLRFRHWPDYLTFDYEKARDLIASMNIYQNKKTDTDWPNHRSGRYLSRTAILLPSGVLLLYS